MSKSYCSFRMPRTRTQFIHSSLFLNSPSSILSGFGSVCGIHAHNCKGRGGLETLPWLPLLNAWKIRVMLGDPGLPWSLPEVNGGKGPVKGGGEYTWQRNGIWLWKVPSLPLGGSDPGVTAHLLREARMSVVSHILCHRYLNSMSNGKREKWTELLYIHQYQSN